MKTRLMMEWKLVVTNGLEIVPYASVLLRQFGYQGFKDFNPRQHLLMGCCLLFGGGSFTQEQ
jgi:hypothetical protein